MTRLRKIHTRRHVQKHERRKLHRLVDAAVARRARERSAAPTSS